MPMRPWTICVGPGYHAKLRRWFSSLVDLEQRLRFRDWEEVRSMTELAGERLKRYFPGWKVRAEVRPGAAASELVSKANE